MSEESEINHIEEQVIDLLANQTNYLKEKIGMDTSIIDDLGVFGDDADELFSAFDERFGIDSQRIDLERFFGHEGMWPWEVFFMTFWSLWGFLLLLVGKPFSKKKNYEDDMKVSDLVDAVLNKKWNKKFEAIGTHNSGGGAPVV
jgi:hypothetical protein